MTVRVAYTRRGRHHSRRQTGAAGTRLQQVDVGSRIVDTRRRTGAAGTELQQVEVDNKVVEPKQSVVPGRSAFHTRCWVTCGDMMLILQHHSNWTVDNEVAS